MTVHILEGDARAVLKTLPDESVHCVVTSPPYWGLRDYGMAGQIGLEPTPDAFVAELRAVFRDVRRVLRADGTAWVNIGDSYNTQQAGNKTPSGFSQTRPSRITGNGDQETVRTGRGLVDGLKPKDLCGVPWRFAFALQADGWWLRQDIIWSKPNPMPESVTDRCTKAHEYLFLLTKSARYHYDAAAIAERIAPASVDRLTQIENQAGSDRVPGKTNGAMKAVVNSRRLAEGAVARSGGALSGGTERSTLGVSAETTRNKRSVWEVTTQPFSEAHFATFPPALIEPCIMAGCPKGGTVLDPFGGAGTTGLVADRLGRNAILIELNPAYAKMARDRINGDAPLFAPVERAAVSRSAD